MPLGKLRFQFDPAGSVKSILATWKPAAYKSEGEYEKDLYAHLHSNFDGVEVTRQFGSSRSRVDLSVGQKVFIELKKDLNSTAKLQRLLGQLELYKKEGWSDGFLIIVGEADKNLLSQAEEGLKRFEGIFDFGYSGWMLIRK